MMWEYPKKMEQWIQKVVETYLASLETYKDVKKEIDTSGSSWNGLE